MSINKEIYKSSQKEGSNEAVRSEMTDYRHICKCREYNCKYVMFYGISAGNRSLHVCRECMKISTKYLNRTDTTAKSFDCKYIYVQIFVQGIYDKKVTVKQTSSDFVYSKCNCRQILTEKMNGTHSYKAYLSGVIVEIIICIVLCNVYKYLLFN